MQILFLDAPFIGTVELLPNTIDYFKENNITKIALYASIQFCNNLEKVKKQLKELNIKVISSQPKRTHVPNQLLGCDNYHDSLNLNNQELDSIENYLYIGDGKFHPLALVYSQKNSKKFKKILCNDPINKIFEIIDKNIIKNNLIKYRSALIKFLSSDNVGIVTTTKLGQEHLKLGLTLETKYPNKKFYHFIDDDISFHQLENFPFIQVWVNTACPRIGFDDQEKFLKGIINLNDALYAETILSEKIY